MIKFRILIWRDSPGLSRWALNLITSVLKRESEIRRGQKKEMQCEVGVEIGVMRPQTKACRQPPGARRHEERAPH